MYVKEKLFYFVLFMLIILIQGRPQGESMVKSPEKLEPVSTYYIYSNIKIKHSVKKIFLNCVKNIETLNIN